MLGSGQFISKCSKAVHARGTATAGAGVLSHFSPQKCMVDGMTLELRCSMSRGGYGSGQNHMGSCL